MQGFQCSAAAQALHHTHPDYFLSNPTDGTPVMEKTYPQLDYRKPEARDWWVGAPLSIGGADSSRLIDGILADGAGPRQVGSPTFANFSLADRERLANGSLAVLRTLQRKFDEVNGGLVLCNGLNMYPNRFNPGTPMLPENNFEIVEECDGVETEHLAAFESRDHRTGKLNITRVRKNLELIERAAALNKSVMINLWAGPVVAPSHWPGSSTPNSTAEWRAALEQHFNFSAALFLTVAAPTVFFEYVEWYPAASGVVPCPSCIAPTQWYPQVYQAVGAPRGPRVDSRGGTVLQRSFANVDVTVDLVTEIATLDWHSGSSGGGSGSGSTTALGGPDDGYAATIVSFGPPNGNGGGKQPLTAPPKSTTKCGNVSCESLKSDDDAVPSPQIRHGSAQGPSMSFGPPQTFEGYGGKMSNTLDLYPDGFASGRTNRPVSSADGGKSFQNVPSNATFFSDFSFHTDAKGHRVAQDFGTGLVYVHAPNVTSVTFNATSIWRFQGDNLTWQNGPDVTYKGLPHPVCGHGTNDWISPHASGHVEFADGTHLHSTIIEWCDGPYPYGPTSLVAFRSSDGIEYEYAGTLLTSLDVPTSSEGPNEHDCALLGNGDVLCVARMGAGDGRGGYMPLYRVVTSDRGSTWSKAEAMPGIGCARPHLVQLDDNITLLSAGRSMMKGAYSRSFSVWASTDFGVTWVRSDGSYHHNHKANITGAPMWPASCNRTGWRFEFTSGYVGLVRVGPRSAMVLYDFMPPVTPAPPPSPSPPPGGQCKIHIHHTIGCFNDSDWQSGTKGSLLPACQASLHGKTSLETCASACHAAKLTVAGVNAGSDCFCGVAADLKTPSALARSRPKAECMASVCDADPAEKECGGPGRLLAYQFTCDPAAVEDAPDTLFDQHNPSYSFAMRIDVHA